MQTQKKQHTKQPKRKNVKRQKPTLSKRTFFRHFPFNLKIKDIGAICGIIALIFNFHDSRNSDIQHKEKIGYLANADAHMEQMVESEDLETAKSAAASVDYSRIKECERLLNHANTLPPYLAGPVFDQAIETYPSATAFIQRALNHAYCNRPQAALRDLSEAEKIDPNRADLYLCRGNIYLLCHQYKEAETCFCQAKAFDQYDPTAYRLQSIACIGRKKPEQALDILNHPLLLQDISTRLTHCYALMECGNYDEAREDALAALKRNPKDFVGYDYLGIIAFKQNDVQTAIDCFSRGLATNHDQAIPICLLNRAYVYMHSGNDEKARKDYMKLHNLRPFMQDPLRGLIQIAYKNAQYEEMLQYIDKLDALNPTEPDCSNRLQAYYKLYGADSTILLCERLLQKYPNYPILTFNAAVLYFSENQLSKAEQLLVRTLSLNPGYTEALSLQGRIAQEQGLLGKAIEYYDKAIELAPQFFEVWYQRGMVYLEQSNFTMAFYDFENAINLNPEYAAAYFGRSLCHYCFHEPELGKKDLATTRMLNASFYTEVIKQYKNLKKASHPGISLVPRPRFDSFYYTEPCQAAYLQTHNDYLRLHTSQTDYNRRTYDL